MLTFRRPALPRNSGWLVMIHRIWGSLLLPGLGFRGNVIKVQLKCTFPERSPLQLRALAELHPIRHCKGWLHFYCFFFFFNWSMEAILLNNIYWLGETHHHFLTYMLSLLSGLMDVTSLFFFSSGLLFGSHQSLEVEFYWKWIRILPLICPS